LTFEATCRKGGATSATGTTGTKPLATIRPRELGQLAGISGVGAAKLERYGAEFLGVIAEHRQQM